MERFPARPDELIAEIARRQHGVVTVQQLYGAGLSPDAVRFRVKTGRLHRIHRGVYAVGHAGLSQHGKWKAATLAFGDDAALSHRSAAELWGMLAPRALIHVTVRTGNGRSHRDRIRIHRTPSLPNTATTTCDGIDVTTPAQTLADLRRTAAPWEFRRARREAEYLRLPLGRIEADGTRGGLEAALLAICRRFGLPEPEVNVRIGRFTVDFLWREQRLVVEVDHYDHHSGRQAFRDDRERDTVLALLGFRAHRFADETINQLPDRVGANLLALLRAGGK